MAMPRVRELRAYVVRGGGADYHDQQTIHWIDDHIATPMSRYPGYEDSRRSFGLNVLGTLVVQVEADDGTVGFGVTTAGEPGAWIVERHLARFLEDGHPLLSSISPFPTFRRAYRTGANLAVYRAPSRPGRDHQGRHEASPLIANHPLGSRDVLTEESLELVAHVVRGTHQLGIVDAFWQPTEGMQ